MDMHDMFSRPAEYRRLMASPLNWGLQWLFLITSICIFVPFFPDMPKGDLESSWIFGMNQAVAQGLAFGRDIIFTFGPYASVYTKSYHPGTDFLMLAGGFYLAISYVIVFCQLTKNSPWYLSAVFWMVLAGFKYYRDVLFFSYPLLVGVFCFRLIYLQNISESEKKLTLALTAILFLPFGLLPLIKGSFLLLCVSISAIAIAMFLVNKNWHLAVATALSPIFSMVFFWAFSGQSISDLPFFFISLIPIISGYTEAMSVKGWQPEIFYYLFAAFILLIAVLREKSIPIGPRFIIFSIFSLFLFLAFKGGFVRHGSGNHATTSGISIVIAALVYSMIFKSKQIPVLLFVSAFAMAYIDSHYVKTSTDTFFENIKTTYILSWDSVKKRLIDKHWPETDFKTALSSLKEHADFPLLQGTTDIYSYNQSLLIASENLWNPRPIVQSYSVYTPSLAEKNKNHLLGKSAPDNVFFKVQPIDERIPAIEDGASWPTLLSRYEPTDLKNNYLYLRKRALSPKASAAELLALGTSTYAFGEVVSIPKAETPLFVEISISQSIAGKIVNVIFKPTPLQISLNLENGVTKTYRIIAGMAKSGLIISPLIENTSEFGLLYGDKHYLARKIVDSFSISPIGGNKLWKESYEVAFKKLSMPPPLDVSKLFKPDGVANSLSNQKSFVSPNYGIDVDNSNGFSFAHPTQCSALDTIETQCRLMKKPSVNYDLYGSTSSSPYGTKGNFKHCYAATALAGYG